MIKATTTLLSWLTLASLLAGCSRNPVSPALVTLSPTVAPTSAPIGSPVEFMSNITGSPDPLGEPGTGDGQFDEPWCVAVDENGNVYVADSLNSRIQKSRQK